MARRIIAAAVVLLTVSGGIAYAAAQATAAKPNTGTTPKATQNGTFTVPREQTVGKSLPLSGISVTGRCEYSSGGGYEYLVARVQLQAASGKKLDAFGSSPTGEVIQGDSILVGPVGAVSSTPGPPYEHASGWTTIIATSDGVTVTITVGGAADWSDQACTFLWQAVEAPN